MALFMGIKDCIKWSKGSQDLKMWTGRTVFLFTVAFHRHILLSSSISGNQSLCPPNDVAKDAEML